ncbi:MAG TPA: MerR family transcriptional regulator [Candidatus Gallacutalibacter stercoravium]|nr:MerR family transcriptional regulator [Candidatus Gallacutalibacter stercoravium]
MAYTIGEVSRMAGVSARTLRHYDAIGLLKPSYVNQAGYRYYEQRQLELLQQILFYRERGFDLKRIQSIVNEQGFDVMAALQDHLVSLEAQRKRLNDLIQTVKSTILSKQGGNQMSEAEKFAALKAARLAENEKRYGAETRQKFGDAAVEGSLQKFENMPQEQYELFCSLEKQIAHKLQQAAAAGIEPKSPAAREIVLLHKKWLQIAWASYSPQAHRALALSYAADPRFLQYYDKEVDGCASLLGQAVDYWVDKL